MATGIAEETLAGMRVVTAFARHPFEIARYTRAVERVFAAARNQAVMEAVWWSSVSLSFSLSVAVIFWYGGVEVLAGRLTLGALVACLFYAMNISSGVSSLGSTWAMFSSSSGASERLFALLDVAADVQDLPAALPLRAVLGSIRFEQVCVAYREGVPVLRGIDLAIEPGERVALVGASGAGKTTFLNLIPRIFDVTSGRVTVDGRDVRDVTLRSLREHIAVVAQDVQLFNDTIAANIRYGRLEATEEEIAAAARAANADGFIRAMPDGYSTVVGVRGQKLSGGQRQRIAVARAMLKGAPILLLDEATSSLDSRSEQLVQSALWRLMEHRTSIIVAHRLATIEHVDRILVLDDGRIVEEGTHRQLVARGGTYASLVRRQLGGRLDDGVAEPAVHAMAAAGS